jgi:arylsulfatase A-like enzyme/Tfp pilus assembly protein PilF
MSRREPPGRPVRWIAVVAALGLVSSLAGRHAVSPRPFPRGDQDILLITIDTLRADALGAYGGAAATPNIDRVAAAGIRFDVAHAHSVVTLPSHTSILTGLYPFAHGVRDNSGYRLKPGLATLASRLRGRGYAAGAFVGAFPLDARFGLDAGFDLYDDRCGSAARPNELSMPERPAADVVAAASQWIGAQRGRWFAWVHLFDPHAPYRPPPPFDRDYASSPYAGEVAAVDAALAPLLDAVRRRARPVLVIVTADHGEALGGHGEATHGLFAYEETLRVPLIVGATPLAPRAAPIATAVPARHIDIVPTVLDALGLPADAALPGRSLLAAVEHGDDHPVPSYFEALTASLNRGWAPLTGIILGREKYIRLPIPELYDLAHDRGEARNLLPAAASRARVLDSLLTRLAEAAPGSAGTSGVSSGRLSESAETRQRLEALGYVSGGRDALAEQRRWTEVDDPKRLIGLDQQIQRAVEEYQRGAVEDARATFESVLGQRPTMATPYQHLAFTWWEAGQPAAAIDTLERAVRSGAGTTEVKSQLGIYLAEGGRPREAIALLRDATSADPADLDAWNGLAIALARGQQQAEAAGMLASIAASHPTHAPTFENLGTVLLSQGRLEAARDAFRRALALDPRLPVALNGLGVVELRSGRREEAIASWRRVIALDPRQTDALYNLGVALMNAGDAAGARVYLEQFAASAPAAFYSEELRQVRSWLAR